MVKRILFVATTAFLILGCDLLNNPLKSFIEESSGIARVLGYEIKTANDPITNDEYNIPPREDTIIMVELENENGLDLELGLVDKDKNPVDSSVAEVVLNPDSYNNATITVYNPQSYDNFEWTMTIMEKVNKRPMSPYKLPKLQVNPSFTYDVEITQFELTSVPGSRSTINEDGTINVGVPPGTPVSNLSPDIAVSPAESDYTPKGAQDFTNPVKYTVTAPDGSSRVYTVTVYE